MTKYEKFSSALGVLGFFLGVLALSVSIWAHIRANHLYKERMAFDNEQRTSKVVIQIGRDINQEKIVFSQHKDRYGYSAIFKQKYNIILNNIGLQTASIINWRVVGKLQMVAPDTGNNMYGWYSGMGPWIYSIDGETAKLPIVIEPNKPKKFFIEIGVRVPEFAWKSVAQKLKLGEEYDYYI